MWDKSYKLLQRPGSHSHLKGDPGLLTYQDKNINIFYIKISDTKIFESTAGKLRYRYCESFRNVLVVDGYTLQGYIGSAQTEKSI